MMNILEKPVLKGTIIVAKIGGNQIANSQFIHNLISDIKLLSSAGLSLAIVHGGGSAIDKKLAAINKIPSKINGLRVTDAVTLEIVVESLSSINHSLVNAFSKAGIPAVGFLPSNPIFQSVKLIQDFAGSHVDLGHTGKIIGTDKAKLNDAFLKGMVAIIAPLGSGSDGSLFNINADHAALAVASALNADKLVSITDVPGLLADPGNPDSIISQISLSEAEAMIGSGSISGGMLPKLQTCIDAINCGIPSVQIIDGSKEHGLLTALTSLEAIGTVVSKSKCTPSSTG